MDKQTKQSSVLEGHSPVNKYELLSVERAARGESGPDTSTILLAFEAFDALIPHLGVYTRIFRKMRDDLYDAIYSEELTTHGDSIMKIPYFLHVKRASNAQQARIDELEDQLETVKKRLFEKHKQFEESQQRVDEHRTSIEKMTDIMNDLRETIDDKSAEIDRLEDELRREREQAETEQNKLEGDILDLKESLFDARQEIEFLSKYKKGYDDLYYAFLDKPEEEDTPRKKKPVVSTKRANLMTNIEASQKLEDQIMTVLNTAVEEFDKFLEEHKSELVVMEIKEDMTEAEFEAQEIDIDNADQHLEAVQERFKNTIGDISNELLLLKQHSTMLMEQLQILEENHPTITKKKEKRSLDAQGLPKSGVKPGANWIIEGPFQKLRPTFDLDSILSAGLGDDDDDDDDSDPFIPQERVFSKYAAMMYTSNNQGRSFEEFKEAKFCQSCGEKTVVCPHKLPGAEKVFQLPIHCTHIKITRPKVKINRELVKELMRSQSPEEMFDLPSTAGSMSMPSRDQISLRGQMTDSILTAQSPGTSRESPSVASEGHMLIGIKMPYSVHSLFDNFKERTNLERSIPRPLTLERTLSVIEQFMTYVIWQDENGKDSEIHFSFLDKLYLYMNERYLVEDIMYLCTHDFVSAIIEYSNTDKTIQLLGNIFAGNLEGSCFRYFMLMCDFICAVEWREVEDFRAFASVVYPFLGEDDLETLQMSYTSFSENKISHPLVAKFIIHLILKYREPRFLDMENRLIPFQAQDSKQPALSEKEFKDAIDNILPLSNDTLRRKLFFEAEKFLRREGYSNMVPIMRLSQIASYLGLLQITNIVKETINSKIQEWRERPSSTGSARHISDHESQVIHSEERLVTMATVKTLATNISRRQKLREQRYEPTDGADW